MHKDPDSPKGKYKTFIVYPNEKIVCSECNGGGEDWDFPNCPCPVCKGARMVYASSRMTERVQELNFT